MGETPGGPQTYRTRMGTSGDPWMSPSSLWDGRDNQGSPSSLGLWGGGGRDPWGPQTPWDGDKRDSWGPFMPESMGWGLERPLGVPVVPKPRAWGQEEPLGVPKPIGQGRGQQGTPGCPHHRYGVGGTPGVPIVPTCAGLKASEPSNVAALCCHLGVGGGKVTSHGTAPWCPQRPYDVPNVPMVPLSPHSAPMMLSPMSPY